MFSLVECRTIGGEDGNTSCKFPFIYNDVLFRKCTLVSHDKKTYWCATETNSTYHYIKKKWGNCSKHCPREGIEGF